MLEEIGAHACATRCVVTSSQGVLVIIAKGQLDVYYTVTYIVNTYTHSSQYQPMSGLFS